MEISKFCYYFMNHGGDIEGKVLDIRPRRSPIPSGGLEIKLLLTFCGPGTIVDKMKQLVREAYTWEYTGQATADDHHDQDEEFQF